MIIVNKKGKRTFPIFYKGWYHMTHASQGYKTILRIQNRGRNQYVYLLFQFVLPVVHNEHI